MIAMSETVVENSSVGGGFINKLLTESFRCDAAFSTRIHDPIIIFERVNGLENGANASHVAIDLRITQKFGC